MSCTSHCEIRAKDVWVTAGKIRNNHELRKAI